MIRTEQFIYTPREHEEEAASNSYVMSMVAIIAGLPLPIFNLIATLIFYLGNRKSTFFVRWHCTQALLSQFTLVILNSTAFWWTISIIFWEKSWDNYFFAYLLTVIIVNIAEFIATIYTAVQTRKGIHVAWWFYGTLTNLVCKPRI
ncbi:MULTISPECIES: DUF4870 domain-containing protein [Sphingobacterium]|uniref:DUF4870 domain-containing protein n=1 Tax=Sphingobacterium populi TaxID=1812824 RepID=A0ABW5UBL9_9SPHI|nr:DUF4870 domain-containing protein [Sphingobacterium sp. CFCC 11742]